MGARPLRQAIERDLVDPLSRLIASQQVKAGDVVEVELSGISWPFSWETARLADTPLSVDSRRRGLRNAG